MIKTIIAAVTGIALFTSVAVAQEENDTYVGPYAKGNVGLLQMYDSDLSGSTKFKGVTFSGDGTVEYGSPGWVVTGGGGWDFGDWRADGEISYRSADLDQVHIDQVVATFGNNTFTANNIPSQNVDGEVSALSFMANGWYDIDLGNRITPYVGGGIGFALVTADVDRFAGFRVNESDSDAVFAYQLGVGALFNVTNNLDVDLGYRYWAALGPDLEFAGVAVDSDTLSSSHIYVGAIYRF